jgi:hypothetical protein
VMVEALKHASGFNREHESCIGAESQMFGRARDTVGPAPKVGAVDFDGLSRLTISRPATEPPSTKTIEIKTGAAPSRAAA